MNKAPVITVDDYIAAAPASKRTALREIRAIVKTVAPDAQEIISYRIPAYRQGRVFVYFAAFKSHIGLYPPVKGSAALEQALRPYRGDKGNLRFALDQPLPYALIKRVVSALKRQYAN
jgi:uncharacterized protein YdhG (YjbR/CyaY superfamily)